MRNTLVLIVAVLVMGVSGNGMVRGLEQSAPERTKESIVGTWKATLDKAPALDIELRIREGKLVGTATLYQLENGGDGPSVKGKTETTIDDVALTNNVLKFSLKREDGTPFKVSMQFLENNVAVLKPIDEKNVADETNVMKMTRSQ